MRELATGPVAKRREFRNLHVFGDLTTYRLPPAGMVSILHRVSGALLFLLLPFIIWMFDTSVSSEYSFARFTSLFNVGRAWTVSSVFGLWHPAEPWVIPFPGWLFKLVALALIWAYLHHMIAGLRHLWMDVSHKAVSRSFGHSSAIFTLVASIVLAIALGAKLFGLY